MLLYKLEYLSLHGLVYPSREIFMGYNESIYPSIWLANICRPPSFMATTCYQGISLPNYFPVSFQYFMISCLLQDFLCLFLNHLLPIHHHISGNTAPRNRVRFPCACGRATTEDDLRLCSLTIHLCICKAQTRKPCPVL